MDREQVAVILPCYNSGKHLVPAVRSILENTEYPFKLFLIESESSDGTAEQCDLFAADERVEVYHTKKEGITKAINFGIEKAGERDIYLTQDDVILPNLYGRDWLETLVNISKAENCGVVTTLNAGGVDWAGQYLQDFQWVGTWSLFIPRKTIRRVGVLDEDFSPGPGDDIDYTYRVIQHKLRVLVAPFWVDHHRQTENYNDNIEYIKMQNAGYFRKKHGISPYWEEFEFDGEKYLLDNRTREAGGCFHRQGTEVESPDTCRLIKELTKDFKEDDVFLDIGAHTGLMSLMVKGGTILAFEPTENTFDILRTNLSVNQVPHAVFNVAVSNEPLKYVVKENHENSGANAVEYNEEGKNKAVVLDNSEIKGNVKLVKIDTEGFDLNVLDGMKKLINKHKPMIIIEYANEGETKKRLENYKLLKKVDNNRLWVYDG